MLVNRLDKQRPGHMKKYLWSVFTQVSQVASVYENLYEQKKYVFKGKEFNSHGICLENQHGHRFIVLEHQYGRRDVM